MKLRQSQQPLVKRSWPQGRLRPDALAELVNSRDDSLEIEGSVTSIVAL